MATNSYIQVPPDSTGKRLYTQQHTVNALPVQAQVMHIGSAVDPTHFQNVDSRGQAYIRFAEGSPSLDAFGNLRVGEGTILGSYEYSHGPSADLFQDTLAVGGLITHQPTSASTILSSTGSNGSSSIRTTNRYHHYQPGVSNLIIQTIALSDTGKAGNRRRWGYFDSNNGLYWELEGTTFYVGIRSNVTGSIVETRVAKDSWNEDKLDGTGVSSMNLDLTKANFYFIDYAWLGVGEVRFGVLGPNGERNICHIFRNPNSNTDAYMASGCLPLRWENTNFGAVGSTSELKSICSAVYSQSRIDNTFWRFSDIGRDTPVAVTTNTPIFSMKVKPGTHVGLYPESLNVYVSAGAVKLTIVDDAVLTGATWGIIGESLALGDIGATSMTGGSKFFTTYVNAGVANIDLSKVYELNDEGYHRLADDSDSYTFTLVATTITGTPTVSATLNYRELR